MGEAQEIDLAREPEFRLGHLEVVPASRELRHDNGQYETLEHRVMQVLVMLAHARGHVVSRDELVRCCWNGRAISEDAINRVISRLRKVTAGIGKGSFDIETVTKIGYRMADSGLQAGDVMMPASASERAVPGQASRGLGRRAVLIGSAAGLAAVAGGGGLLYRHLKRPAVSPEVEALMAQGWQAWAQATGDGPDQAMSFYRRATELDPGHADAWGLLGCTYADAAHRKSRAEAEAEKLRDRARAAARQALDLDPHNAYGRAALAYARPMMGNWLLIEREFRRARAEQPDRLLILHGLGNMLLRVGRCAEAAAELEQLHIKPDPPVTYYLRVLAEWGADRIEQAERLMDEGMALYPAHPALWRTYVNLAMFGGNPGKAMALVRNERSHPAGLGQDEITWLLALGEAIEHRDPAQVAHVAAIGMAQAHRSSYEAVNAIRAAGALGRVDEAFLLLDAFYFSRGFMVPDVPPAPDRVAEATLEERATGFLFLPVMRPVRADARFGRLTEALGLERYWRDAGAPPDFRAADIRGA